MTDGAVGGEQRPVPFVDKDSYDFWHGGAAGQLLIRACTACRRLFHPPAPICPNCYARSLVSCPVSGRATLLSHTVVRRAWVAGYDRLPYVVARVVLAEQADLHLVTNIVNCAPDAVRPGMALEVVFEHREDVYVPMFQPVP